MMPFFQCDFIYRSILIFLFFALFTGLIFLFLIRWINRRHLSECILPGLLLLVVGVTIINLMNGHHRSANNLLTSSMGLSLANLPWAFFVLLLFIFNIYFINGILWEKKNAQNEITLNSIREAFDNLPSGLCFSNENGIPLLTNRRMYQLVEEVTGRYFRNTEELWQQLLKLQEQKGIERLHQENIPTFRLVSGTIWQFSKAQLILNNQNHTQITAMDITRLYTLTKELGENNANLDEQYKKLKNLMSEIIKMTKQEEILASKVKIHEVLGECLLSSRRYLMQNESRKNSSRFFQQWENVVKFIEGTLKEEKDTTEYAMRELIEAAESLGCTIVLEGLTQKDAGRYPILKNAIREAMTNAIRHAGADKLIVQMEIKMGVLNAVIKDNGSKPMNSIYEGSGLSALRNRIEKSGGKMEICFNESVELHIEIPLEEEL